LDLGQSLAGLITRKSGIHRRSVYDALERLIQKGLVGYIVKNNRKYFEATNPDRLTELLKEKEESVKNILPQLKAKYEHSIEKSETLFYKGKSGLKTIFEDQLSVKKEILILGASSLTREILKYYFHWFDKRRIEKKIKIKLVYNESARKDRRIRLAKIRYLPKDYYNPAAMNIYGDRVAIIHWSKENPFVILIKDKEIADGYRNYFNLLWNIAKK
ncbi:MAG: helix-turn-helix domain-containing protein, partial [Nanoarchaeota archaeon]